MLLMTLTRFLTLHHCHETLMVGHFGVDKSLYLVSWGYYSLNFVILLRTKFIVAIPVVNRRVLDIDPMGCYTIIASNFHRSLSP